MGILSQLKDDIAKRVKEKDAEAARAKAEYEYRMAEKALLEKQIDDTLNELNGTYGFTRKQNQLYRGEYLVAELEVKWEPGDDRCYDMGGCAAHYWISATLYDRFNRKTTGCDLSRLSSHLAEYVTDGP